MIPHLHPHAGDCEHACCLKIEHLSVHIGGETILDNIDLHMHCGQMVALIGPNGAGKSTLIRAILGQREYEGKITFHEASGKEAKLRIGYVPQSPAFDRGDPVSVMDLFTCCIFRRPAFLRPTKAMREKVLACLENVHGEALIDKRIGARAGGERQRVLLALALEPMPNILILDEPTPYVDSNFEKEFYTILEELNKSLSIVMVSHDLGTICSYVKTIACVNRELHYHNSNLISAEQLQSYHCPIELITHGKIPHRVLKEHEKGKQWQAVKLLKAIGKETKREKAKKES